MRIPSVFAIALVINCGASSAGDVPPGCGVKDVRVSMLKLSRQTDVHVKVTGVLRHTCNSPVGVSLKWTAFDKQGFVIFSEDKLPAYTHNIEANVDYPFELIARSPEDVDKFTVVADHITVW